MVEAINVLNKYIEKGSPPETIALEYNKNGHNQIIFTWGCDTVIRLPYTHKTYIPALMRFLNYWAGVLDNEKLNKNNILNNDK